MTITKLRKASRMLYELITKRNAGFTLIEMLIVISIFAIITAVSLPYFVGLFMSNRVSGAKSDFVSALRYAKNEAVTRAVNVEVIAKNSVNFSSGWVVSVVGSPVIALRKHEQPGRVIFTASDGVTNAFVFNPRGFLVTPSSSVSLNISAPNSNKKFTVNVLSSGQVDVLEN